MSDDMNNTWYVEVRYSEDDHVVRRIGPMDQWKARKVEDGVSINLDHERFYTEVVDDAE